MTSGGLQFKAFISYSHRDKGGAAWLHRALETYRVPKHLIGRETGTGLVTARVGKVFRDRDELAVSADLSGEINEALKSTQFLVVLCSPASAKSPWVNQEIINFKRLKGDGSIISVIVDGEPYASTTPGQEGHECFAPALRFQVNDDGTVSDRPAEPIAADMRPHADGKRLAKLKVIAGLLGVGLDELVQRENQRRQRRLALLSAASVAGMVVMSGLTWNAVTSQQLAEERRVRAEDLIEFMLVDLRDKLEPVGRLDVLDTVGERAIRYYDDLNPGEMDDSALGRRTRALLFLAEIEELKGNLTESSRVYNEAKQTTRELLGRDPKNPNRIFDHAQSLWLTGYANWQRGQFDLAELDFNEYLELSLRLLDQDPDNIRWLNEVGDAYSNMGTLYLETMREPEALAAFENAKTQYERVLELDPNKPGNLLSIAYVLGWLSHTNEQFGNLYEAIRQRQSELEIYAEVRQTDPKNKVLLRELFLATGELADLSFKTGAKEEAIFGHESAVRMAEELLALDPDNSEWMYQAGITYINFSEALAYQGQTEASKKMLREGLDFSEKLTAKDQKDIRSLVHITAKALFLETKLAFLERDIPRATSLARRCLEELNHAKLNGASLSHLQQIRIDTLLLFGDIQRVSGQSDEAQLAWTEARTIALNSFEDPTLDLEVQLALLSQRLNAPDEFQKHASKVEQAGFRRPDFIEALRAFESSGIHNKSKPT